MILTKMIVLNTCIKVINSYVTNINEKWNIYLNQIKTIKHGGTPTKITIKTLKKNLCDSHPSSYGKCKITTVIFNYYPLCGSSNHKNSKSTSPIMQFQEK